MEKKNKNKNNNNNNNTSEKKKKYKSFKKYSLCFPFHIDIKIIKDQKLILNIINTFQNLLSMKPNPFLYGLNTTLNCIQNPKKEEKMIFVFYKKNMESLYDIMLFRAKMNKNIFIYYIDDEWQKKFLEIFKLKKLLSFVYVKNNTNETKFNELKNNLENYNINNDINMIISNNKIQEIIIETK